MTNFPIQLSVSPYALPERTHVIEYSAYQSLLNEIRDLRDDLKNKTLDYEHLQNIRDEYFLELEKLKKLLPKHKNDSV
jgi:hypothetical protein